MPDGDIIHPTLGGRYYSVYKQICEGSSNEEELARQALRSLKKEVKVFGEAPIQLLEQAASLFQELAIQQNQGTSIDWTQVRRDLQTIAQFLSGSKRALQLALRACYQHIRTIQDVCGSHALSSDLFQELSGHYLLNIYDAQFEKRVPQTYRHYNQADPAAIQMLLHEIRPLVIRGIHGFASQIVKQGNARILRLPMRVHKIRKIDLTQDLDRDLSELM